MNKQTTPKRPKIKTDDKYILVKGKVRKCTDLLKWAEWFQNGNRQIERTKVGKFIISTVFLGLDYNFGFNKKRKPVLFETMVFTRMSKRKADRLNAELKKAHRTLSKKYPQSMPHKFRPLYQPGSLDEATGFGTKRYETTEQAKRGHWGSVRRAEALTGKKRQTYERKQSDSGGGDDTRPRTTSFAKR